MKYQLQEKFTGGRLTRPVASVSRFRARAGQITDFDIWADFPASFGDITFQLYINGVAQFASGNRPVLLAEASHVAKTGLAFTVAKGDIISVDAEIVGVDGLSTPIYFEVTIDDGIPNGSIESLQDLVGAMFDGQGSGGVTVSYVDASAVITVVGTAPPTTEQIQDLIAAFLVQGANITITYDDGANTLTIAATGGGGAAALADLTDVDTTTTPPTTADNLTWDGTKWIPQPPASGATLAGDVTGAATSNLVERIQNREISPTFQPPSSPIVFEDNFNDGTISTVLWDPVHTIPATTAGGGVVESGGELAFTMGGSGVTGNQIKGIVPLNFTGKKIEVDTVDFLDTLAAVSEGAVIAVVDNALSTNAAKIRHEQDDYFFEGFNAGTPDRITPDFFTADKIRIQHNHPANTWGFWTFNSGVWSLQHTTAAMSWDPTNVRIEVIAYEYHGTPSGHQFIIDNLVTDATFVTGTDSIEQGSFPVFDLGSNKFEIAVVKVKSVTTGSIGAGASALVTVTWDEPFVDSAYFPDVIVLDSTAAALSLRVVKIESRTASAITVRVENTSLGSLTGTVLAKAIRV